MLESFAAGSYSYELSIERKRPTVDAGPYVHDPFSVRLSQAGHLLDQLSPVESSCGIESLSEGGVVRGADSESKSWNTSGDNCDIAVAARSVALSEQHTGFLVTLHAGVEYRYSFHYLYLAENDRLRTLWKFEEDTLAGQRSRTSVIAASSTSALQDIAFTHLQRDDLGIATKLTATRLHFDPTRLEMAESPLPDEHSSLHVLVLGNYPGQSAALARDLSCVFHLDLLKKAFTPGLDTPRFYFGGVFGRRNDAEAAAPDPVECSEFSKPQLLEYRAARRSTHAKAD